MTGVTLPFSCKCGTVHGTLDDITPSAGTQLQCQCDDCRRVVIWLGQPDPGIDGVRYYQTTPSRVSFDTGPLAACPTADLFRSMPNGSPVRGHGETVQAR